MGATKVCTKCGDIKHVSEFSKNARGRNGLDSRCKSCARMYQEENKVAIAARKKEYARENWESMSAYQTSYYARNKDKKVSYSKQYGIENKAKISKANKVKAIEFPHLHASHNAVKKAISSGTLDRPCLCQFCGTSSHVEYHHSDYSAPLWVTPLCGSCHKKEHYRIRRESP